MYDIFYINQGQGNDTEWKKIKTKFPLAQRFFDVTDLASIQEQCFTKMFWIIWDDINILDSFDLKNYRATQWDDNYIHVFKNGDYYDGLCLVPKNKKISKKEFDNRFFLEKKEVDILASMPKKYDMVFISYNEINAEENFKKLSKRYPQIKRIENVKGIHQAHIAAANLCDTDYFWVIDGDAIVLDAFDFSYKVPKWEKNIVHVWRSKNPINNLEYGNGGLKLLPRRLTLEMNTNSIDMTTSISNNFKSMKDVSNITAFNTDPFNAWKSAFRECVKLSSKVINGQVDAETQSRLKTWCTVGLDKQYGNFAIAGAIAGTKYGEENKNSADLLKCINDFDWLRQRFEQDTI